MVEALGVFNQSFAVYLIPSQLAAAGIPYSAWWYVCQVDGDDGVPATLMEDVVMLAVIADLAAAVLVFALAPAIGVAFAISELGAMSDAVPLMMACRERGESLTIGLWQHFNFGILAIFSALLI